MQIAEAMKSKTDHDALFTIAEICEYLTLKTTTVYNLIADGEIKAIKLAGATRVRRSELQRYIDEAKPAVIKKSIRR